MSKDYIAAAISDTEINKDYTTPQSKPVSSNQVRNSAGGYSFKVDDMERLNRFLFLGSEGGTYYISERALTQENARAVIRAIDANGLAVAKRIYEVSTQGLALRQNPTLFAWALVARYGDDNARRFVYAHTSEVARTGTMLFTLVDYLNKIAGWSRGRRTAIGNWYTNKDARSLAYQIAKYPQRAGWSHLDVLRQAHPDITDEASKAVMDFVTGKIDAFTLEDRIGPNAISGAARARQANSDSELVRIVKEYKLSWEMIPTEALNKSSVWDELVLNSGYAALLRNLNRLTNNGWLAPASSNRKWMIERLTDQEFINGSRIHPFAIYLASRTYGAGRGLRGNQVWTPVTGITDALDDAFFAAFSNVEPTGQRYLLGVDISGSMVSPVLPGVSAMEASAALALILAKTEDNVQVVGFDTKIKPFDLGPKSTINSVRNMFGDGWSFGGTDCARLFEWAKQKNFEFDCFASYTDNETWAGRSHPHKALQAYRKASGIPARSAVVAMASNGFSIADPDDAGMMDFVGLDASLPQVMRSFFVGDI